MIETSAALGACLLVLMVAVRAGMRFCRDAACPGISSRYCDREAQFVRAPATRPLEIFRCSGCRRAHWFERRPRGRLPIDPLHLRLTPPCLLRSLPAGAVAGWGLHPLEKRRLVTARGKRSFATHPYGGLLLKLPVLRVPAGVEARREAVLGFLEVRCSSSPSSRIPQGVGRCLFSCHPWLKAGSVGQSC
jgi:hypothetical protein